MSTQAIMPSEGAAIPANRGNRHSHFQKRIDKLVRENYQLAEENEGLHDLLDKYEETIRKYKQALGNVRRVNSGR